jgi:hypothetical protein
MKAPVVEPAPVVLAAVVDPPVVVPVLPVEAPLPVVPPPVVPVDADAVPVELPLVLLEDWDEAPPEEAVVWMGAFAPPQPISAARETAMETAKRILREPMTHRV